MIGCDEPEMGKVRVKVVGVGNAGGMIVKRVAREHLPGVECGVINTAIKDLGNCPEVRSLQIGTKLTRGHGAGMDPQIGRKAAQEDADKIRDFLGANDLLFLIAGFGKGTGTGATPVVGELSKETSALTIALVTTPFDHEKRRHHEVAEEGLREIKGKVDVYVPLSNQRLFSIPSLVAVEEAFVYMDEVILQAVRGVVDILLRPGRMNVDLADIRTLFKGAGQAAFAVGTGKGESRVADATRALLEFPFLEEGQLGSSKSLLVSLSGGPDLAMSEVKAITAELGKVAEGDVKLAQGIYLDESMQGEIRVQVLASSLSSVEPFPPEFELHAEKDQLRGIPLYQPSLWPQRQSRPAGDREAGPVREDKDNMDIPAYLRKGKNGPTAVPRN